MIPAYRLSSAEVPRDWPLRDLPPRARDPGHAAWAHYDRKTLLYDAIYLPSARSVRLFLPRLHGLSARFSLVRAKLDGKPAGLMRHRVHRRFETFDIACDVRAPAVLQLGLPEAGDIDVPISTVDWTPFEERNVLYTLQRNEKLDWIRDWLRFHHKVQEADAVLIADNGSSAYGLDELAEALNSVPGYRTVRILSVPLPWGPRGNSTGVDDGKFLQTALLNLVRDRFLFRARAVLNVDVDELAVRRGPSTVFDRAQRWGYVTFPGEWRYVVDDIGAPRHADHVYRDPNGKPCATKYAFRPASMLGRMCLSVHSLEALNRRLFSGSAGFRFLHCRSITTSWKTERTKQTPAKVALDEETQALFRQVFGVGTGAAP